jgi:hypothetical protein
MPDVVLFGIELPFLLVIFIFSGLIHLMVDALFVRWAVYNNVWHPGLFRVAIFMCIFSVSGLIFYVY